MSIYIFFKNKNKIYLTIAMLSILIICILDLAMSFGIMIYILAIFIGIISKEYLEVSKEKLKYKNSYFSIVKLSFAIVALIPIIYFSVKIYRASLIIVETRIEPLTSEEYLIDIEMLNRKIKLDKYDPRYMTALIVKEEEYKNALSAAYFSDDNQENREYIKSEIANSVTVIKEKTDILLNNEYEDKYILELAAKTYFANFMSFANIYEKQFKDKELAYSFYLGYALKLTDRINQIAPYNIKSKEIALNIYTFYLKELTRQNDIIQSESIYNMCEILKLRIEENT